MPAHRKMVRFPFNKQWHILTCVTFRLRPSSLTSTFTLTGHSVTTPRYNTFRAAVFSAILSIKPKWTFCKHTPGNFKTNSSNVKKTT